jgi:hypothetical protein
MAAHNLELHHREPRCLFRIHDRAVSGELDGAGIAAWLQFEHEAMRYGVDVEIFREDLAELVEASTVLLARDEHRNGHQSDWQRWGRRGGLETARRYGSSWFALLALRRWGRISPADLDALAKPPGPAPDGQASEGATRADIPDGLEDSRATEEKGRWTRRRASGASWTPWRTSPQN